MSYKGCVSVLIGLLALENLSWLAFIYPGFSSGITAIILLAVLIASIYHLPYGVYAVVTELVIGSQGHMFEPNWFGVNVPIRYGLFIVVLLAWIITAIQQRKIMFFKTSYWPWLVGLGACGGLSIMLAYWHGVPIKQIFLDANGYVFFALVLPISQAITTKQQLHVITQLIVVGIVLLFLKTTFILFMYSHFDTFYYYIPALYRWIRDLRLGEITRYDTGFSRVFFQSHIYSAFALCNALAAQLLQKRKLAAGLAGIAVVLLVLSYSRSFWVATIGAVGLLFIYVKYYQLTSWQQQVKVIAITVACTVITLGFILAIINMPLGKDQGTALSAQTLLVERTTELDHEPAAQSRMALLKPLLKQNLQYPVLGAGFGSTVTYYSEDERIKNVANPTGAYITFSFEWGYLDLWLKLGLIGLLLYGGLIVNQLYRAHKLLQIQPDVLLLGTSFAVIVLISTHALTPYLNHPLGIGYLLLFMSLITVYETAS